MKLTCLLAWLLPLSIWAQTDVPFTKESFPEHKKAFKEAKKWLETGDGFYYGEQNGYNAALYYYQKANDFNPNNAELNLKMGVCYLHTTEKFNALKHLEKAAKLNPQVHVHLDWYLGQAHQYRSEYDKALKSYTRFKDAYFGSNEDTLRMIDQKLQECVSGKQYYAKPLNYKLENMGPSINTKYKEYTPLITADESMLVFTARRPYGNKSKISGYDFDYYEKIYVSYYRDKAWTAPVPIDKPVNKKNRHDAAISISLDGQTIYIYREQNNGDIYYSKLQGNAWGKVRPMPDKINSEFDDSHIAISYDGNTALIVSDRPGGLGGKDIWRVDKINEQEWGDPVNLGAPVNTPFDEDAVFIHPDGKTMYFSSKGHKGMGGYDIYESVFENGAWSTPKNLQYPINGPDDDIFFVLTTDGMNAYLSSAKESGLGGEDLYMIRPFNPANLNDTIPFKEFDVTLFNGLLIDKETQKPVGGKVEIVDNSTGEKIFVSLVNSSSGKFVVTLPVGKNYGIAVESDGYLFHSENFDMKAQEGFKEVKKVIELQKVREGSSLVLNNVFFDFNKWDLKSESKSELNRTITLLNKYPEYKIIIEGHTDDIGSSEVNLQVSQYRADAVKNYLIQNGIKADRIMKSVGFGENEPIAPNTTPEGRAKNRRVEINLVK